MAVQQPLFDPGPAANVAEPLPQTVCPNRVVDELIGQLAEMTIGATCNFYADDSDPDAPARRERLRRYLTVRWDAPLVLVGEAPGWRGARLSGIAFTSVAQLGVGEVAEASATVVHRTLAELGLEEQVLLWNTVPTHPHLPGRPRSNRPPTVEEIAAGAKLLPVVTAGRAVVAVGQVAARSCEADHIVRHPSHGGARRFADGLRRIGGVP